MNLAAAWFAFRGLYSWCKPQAVALTLIVFPFSQTLFFSVVLGQAQGRDTAAIGLQVATLTSGCVTIFGGVMLVAYEQFTGTWDSHTLTPTSWGAILWGRAVVLAALGATLGLFHVCLTAAVLSGEVTWRHVAAVLLFAIVTTPAGLLLGVLCRRMAEPLVVGNIAMGFLFVFGGAILPNRSLPQPLGYLASALPGNAVLQWLHAGLPQRELFWRASAVLVITLVMLAGAMRRAEWRNVRSGS